MSRQHRDTISNDDSESTWEEMEMSIAQDSNMTANGLLLMVGAGVVAVVGLVTDAIHIVAGAMVIAPGFEPITRIALGVVAKSRGVWVRGVVHTTQAYLALVVGAVVGVLVMSALGYNLFGSGTAYLPAGELVGYWANMTVPSLLTSAMAALAGGVLIAANRSVLTAGVMLALALVPSLAVGVLGVMAGDLRLAGLGVPHWALDVLLVLVGSLIVFGWKSRRHKRRLWL